jgi:hypothetical protein
MDLADDHRFTLVTVLCVSVASARTTQLLLSPGQTPLAPWAEAGLHKEGCHGASKYVPLVHDHLSGPSVFKAHLREGENVVYLISGYADCSWPDFNLFRFLAKASKEKAVVGIFGPKDKLAKDTEGIFHVPIYGDSQIYCQEAGGYEQLPLRIVVDARGNVLSCRSGKQ